ncbi:hypothetical protein Tco_1218139 [Tanacetum coccineum]
MIMNIVRRDLEPSYLDNLEEPRQYGQSFSLPDITPLELTLDSADRSISKQWELQKTSFQAILNSEPPLPTPVMETYIPDSKLSLRRLNNLLEAGLIYPISSVPWVSPITLSTKEWRNDCGSEVENELFPIVGYGMASRLAGNEYYCSAFDGFFSFSNPPLTPVIRFGAPRAILSDIAEPFLINDQFAHGLQDCDKTLSLSFIKGFTSSASIGNPISNLIE